jgi:hypothetical protein
MLYDTIEFSEIRDYKQFEDLATAYFRYLKETNNSIISVFVEPSGEETDGGRDILLPLKYMMESWNLNVNGSFNANFTMNL